MDFWLCIHDRLFCTCGMLGSQPIAFAATMTGGSAKDYRTALELIETGKVDVSPLISHMYSFDDMQQAYDMALSGDGLKIVMAHNRLAASQRRWLNNRH